MNLLAICDHELNFTNMVVRWQGSVPESRIFRDCSLYGAFEKGDIDGWLLGDSSYFLILSLVVRDRDFVLFPGALVRGRRSGCGRWCCCCCERRGCAAGHHGSELLPHEDNSHHKDELRDSKNSSSCS